MLLSLRNTKFSLKFLVRTLIKQQLRDIGFDALSLHGRICQGLLIPVGLIGPRSPMFVSRTPLVATASRIKQGFTFALLPLCHCVRVPVICFNWEIEERGIRYLTRPKALLRNYIYSTIAREGCIVIVIKVGGCNIHIVGTYNGVGYHRGNQLFCMPALVKSRKFTAFLM